MTWHPRAAGRFRSVTRHLRTATVAIALTAASCTSDPSASVGEAPSDGTTPSAEVAGTLVGTWERETRCEELVPVLRDEGLERWVLEFVAGNGFVPGVSAPDEIADPADPCAGAVPRVHSHFFTEDGSFGSLDWHGEQVDDGTYELVGNDTFVVSKEFPDVTFHYTIDGDTISFDPVVPDCAPKCFEAAWSVTVAYPGESWERVS